MRKYETLLDKAKQSFTVAQIIYKTMAATDDAYLNYVGYHLQQSVELAIKFVLEMNGIEYPKTYDITQLIQFAEKKDINLFLSEYIDEHSEMLSTWEDKTRYMLNYRLESRKIDKAIDAISNYFNTLEKELPPYDEIIDENMGAEL